MLPKSNSSTATSIDATRRRLNVGIVMATLLTLAAVIADLASGGRPDPPTLRAAATTLDGAWRFHTGDEPRWANANTDDSDWETIDMTASPGSHDGDVGLPDYVGGWMAHGHPGFDGYAWYRRAVTVPAGHASWDILGPTLVRGGFNSIGTANYWVGRGGSARARVSSERGRCGSPFPTMRPAPAAYSPFAHSCVKGPRPAQTAAACTPRPSWLRDRSAMRFTACNGNEPSPVTSSM